MSPLPSAAPAPSTAPSLRDFLQAAEQGAELIGPALTDLPAVFGPGRGSASGVTWLRGTESTTQMFTRALRQSFGAPISEAIARELSLDPASARPLTADLVQLAIEVGESARPALEGVDFVTRTRLAATTNGPDFCRIARAQGLDPAHLDHPARLAIDARMGSHFHLARASGRSPVAMAEAEQWLLNELISLTK